MPASRRAPASDEEDEEELDDEEEETPQPAKPARRSGAASRRRTARSPSSSEGLRPWKASSEDGEWHDPDEVARGEDDGGRRVYYRIRDAWWFEPLVALGIIVVLLVSLTAYTSNWPPVYVVESMSMQHGYTDEVGLINTGDLVLAKQISLSDVVPYVVGMQTGYTTYGEYGDVLLYHPNDNLTVAPIIHRSIVYLDYSSSNGSYAAPELAGLPCGVASDAVYSVSNTPSGCGTAAMRGTLTLYHIGWRSVTVDIPLDPSILGRHSGFVTMGDNNFDSDNASLGVTDQVGLISSLVEGSWILGVARGMIPWFGAIKLLIDGDAGEVPPQSWQALGLTIVAIFAAALGIHLFLRREGIEDERRRLREEEEGEGSEEEAPPKHRGLRFWAPAAPEEAETAPDATKAPKGQSQTAEKTRAKSRRGRPVPKVGRKTPPPSDDEDEL